MHAKTDRQTKLYIDVVFYIPSGWRAKRASREYIEIMIAFTYRGFTEALFSCDVPNTSIQKILKNAAYLILNGFVIFLDPERLCVRDL